VFSAGRLNSVGNPNTSLHQVDCHPHLSQGVFRETIPCLFLTPHNSKSVAAPYQELLSKTCERLRKPLPGHGTGLPTVFAPGTPDNSWTSANGKLYLEQGWCPCAVADRAKIPGPRRRAQEASVSDARCSLLVVDDEEHVLYTLSAFLAGEFNVLTAVSADAAKQIFAEQRVDIILTDQRMPGTTGVQLLERVRQTC